MPKRRISLVLLFMFAAGVLAAGLAIAGKERGNDKKFEYAIGRQPDRGFSDADHLPEHV